MYPTELEFRKDFFSASGVEIRDNLIREIIYIYAVRNL